MPPSKMNDRTMNDRAMAILRGNDRGGYTIPSQKLYPFQWNWDSCLCALGWARFDEPRAWLEIETLFDGQWANGMVPHMLYHDTDTEYEPGPGIWDTGEAIASSGITQPPVAAFCVRRMVETARDKDLARDKAARLFDGMLRWHRWYHTHRDPKATGLVKIIHPWESGRDNSPDWNNALARVPTDAVHDYTRMDNGLVGADQRPNDDEYDRYMSLVQLFRENDYDHEEINRKTPFKVADLGINAILHRADKDLRWLAGYLDAPQPAIEEITGWIAHTAKAFEQLWSDEHGAYCSLDLISDEHVPVVTSAAFLPFFAGVTTDQTAAALLDKLNTWAQRVNYLVPSYDPECAMFESRRYWSGPVWAIINFMIATGLQEKGHTDMAARIAEDTSKLMHKSGFMEYYDPIDGSGLGGGEFSWTAAMWLCWLDDGLENAAGKAARQSA